MGKMILSGNELRQAAFCGKENLATQKQKDSRSCLLLYCLRSMTMRDQRF
ncbi:MAG TPA: hypothetical protein VJ603_08775 [Paucimonas sp.]|nr:hypothetical protein [Paucimonas sp.]